MDEKILFESTPTKELNIHEISLSFNIETDHELIEKLNLGKKKHICKLCEAEGEFQTWKCLENYIGLKDEFIYFICAECETMQIIQVPERIERYHPASHYKFQTPPIEPAHFGALQDTRMILDVGCGAGGWLCFLATRGCVNLFGCDSFIDRDLSYSNGVKIKKCGLHEMDGKYDVIRFSQSFGQLANPHEAFQDLDRLLKYDKGVFGEKPKIEIIMEIFPNKVFDIYGPYWYRMDAPRNFFIHSLKGIQMLVKKYGFELTEIHYDDSAEQFIFSRMHQLNVPQAHVYQRYEGDSKFVSLKNQKSIYEILGKAAAFNKCSSIAMLTLTRP